MSDAVPPVGGSIAQAQPHVRPYEPGDEAAVLALYETVLGRALTASQVAHRLDEGPGGPARRAVLVAGDEVIGHTAMVPLPAWVDGRLTMVPIGCDSMTAPAWQGQGVFTQLARAPELVIPEATLGVSLTRERPLRAFEHLTRSTSQERLRHWISWNSVGALERSWGRAVPRPIRRPVSLGLRVLARGGRIAATGVGVSSGVPSDLEMDELAERSSSFARVIHVRDARYLRWRWASAENTWHVHHARDRAGSLLGWSVSGIDPSRAPGTGVIADLLALTPRATTALLRAAADSLGADGAQVVSFGSRDPRPWSRAASAAAGFARRGLGPPILTFPLNGADSSAAAIDGWYLTTGELI